MLAFVCSLSGMLPSEEYYYEIDYSSDSIGSVDPLILYVNWTSLIGQEIMDRIKGNISKLKNQIKKKCGNCKVKMPDLRLTEGESIELDYPKVENFEDIKGLRHDDSYKLVVLYPDWDKLVGGGLLKRKVTQLQEQIQERCKTEKCKVRMLSFGDDEITIYFKTERGKKKHRPEDFLDIKGIREKQASDNLYSDELETDQVKSNLKSTKM